MRRACLLLPFVLVVAALLPAQAPPRISGVEPVAGKAGATATASGENLGKPAVIAVYLSDAETDHKVTVIEQTAEKIVFRVPSLKPATYNLSIQVKNDIFIQPVRFTVE